MQYIDWPLPHAAVRGAAAYHCTSQMPGVGPLQGDLMLYVCTLHSALDAIDNMRTQPACQATGTGWSHGKWLLLKCMYTGDIFARWDHTLPQDDKRGGH